MHLNEQINSLYVYIVHVFVRINTNISNTRLQVNTFCDVSFVRINTNISNTKLQVNTFCDVSFGLRYCYGSVFFNKWQHNISDIVCTKDVRMIG